MKKCKNLFVFGIFLLTVFASCEKDNNGQEPEDPGITSWTWGITGVLAKVELEGETENDKELIEQIENEVKAKMALLGDNFTFTTIHENPSSGKLVRTFKETQKIITTEYLFETEDNRQYLKIIEKNVVTDIFQVSPKDAPSYLVKDFTKDYTQFDNRIVSVLGAARYIIPR